MSAKGYVVRGKRGSDGAEIAAWTHDGGIGSPVSAARFRTSGQACGAADALTYRGCTDVTILAVAEDGSETPLPSYEEALAKLDAVCAAAEDVCSDYTEEGETKGPLSLRINRLMAALAARKART